jgi:pyruvate/2-oxoglutarate dehydrogenase complex dihydrolipoamide dehydrogenase (E3) component
MQTEYDLAILGAGSGGLVAASFAARLGRRVALVEKSRIGGDCTWTGCVPSKALLKAAKVAHEARTAARYGITVGQPVADMARVRDYVRGAIERVYRLETPEELAKQGIDVVLGAARFLDAHSVRAGEGKIRAKAFLITTGARPAIPKIDGIDDVPFLTYEQIFENGRLPERLIVVGGGPVGVEIAQAYRRLGSQVSIIAPTLLPKDEPEARARIERVFETEGIRLERGRAASAAQDAQEIVIGVSGGTDLRADMLFVASGRRPNVDGLDLEKAGVRYSVRGVEVDDRLRTTASHIYAAGDVAGGHQFTHFAGWQAFQAVRNALLPGSASGFAGVVPWVTFTDPEVAHAGLTVEQARSKFGGRVRVLQWELSHVDRAICEGDQQGFVKLVTREDGTILGATIVAARAGEAITEFVLALQRRWNVRDLAGAIHAYPTYSTPVQQMAAELAVDRLVSGTSGRLLLGLSKLLR